MADNDRAQQAWANAFQKPVSERHLNDLPPKREVMNPSPADELEGAVMKEVIQVISLHPNVMYAVRQNGGSASYTSKGREVPIWFYRQIRKPFADCTMTDFWGFMLDGSPFAIEAKRRSWTTVRTEREQKQLTFINMIRKVCKGRGGFVTSGEQALAILNEGI